LYGSSDNWVGIGKKLAENFEVYIIDQRNHGKSPHSHEHNYRLLKNDLKDFMDQQGINQAILVGHSMGGKTAMFFATEFSNRIKQLIIVDISPKSYYTTNSSQLLAHNTIIRAMYNIDFYGIKSRQEIDVILAKLIPEIRVRQFLLKNVRRQKSGEFYWGINIKTIKNELYNIIDGLPDHHPEIKGFPILFIKGEKSDYINDDDRKVISKIFPFAQIENIPNAGHWVHAEQTELFLQKINNFLLE